MRDKLPAGRIQVIGTPAEEGGGGKIRLIKGGVFQTVDAAMMIHGFDRWILHQDLLGITRAGFEFPGKAAHASADPWEGVNALDAVIQTFNNVSMLRQQIRPDARIHGIVTNGGAAPNIIPEVAACTFYVRAAKLDYMWELYKRVVACAEGAAKATGCTMTVIDMEAPYEPLKRNDTLLGLFKANMTSVGAAESPAPDRLGSSDIGNVSQVIPAIQPMVQDRADRDAHPLARLRGGRGHAAGSPGHVPGRQDDGHDHVRPARRSRPGQAGARGVRGDEVSADGARTHSPAPERARRDSADGDRQA